MSKNTLFDVQQVFIDHPGLWLSSKEVLDYMVNKVVRSTVRRVLRRLHSLGVVDLEKSGRDKYGTKKWQFVDAVVFFKAPTPPRVKKHKIVRTPAKSVPFTAVYANGDRDMDIKKAVQNIVAENIVANKIFTAHDVTTALRTKVNAGTVTVDPGTAGTVHVGGRDVPRIDHDEVKDHVHQEFLSGSMTGYDRVHNTDHFAYQPGTVTTQAASSAGAVIANTPTQADPDPAPVSTYDGSSTI